MARAVIDGWNRPPLLSEPVVGTVALTTEADDLELLALAADGKVASRQAAPRTGGVVAISLPAGRGTHWFVLKSRGAAPRPAAPEPEAPPASPR